MPNASTALRLVAAPAPRFVPRPAANADAFDLGPARRALVGLLAACLVILGAAGWAHTDLRTAAKVRQAQIVRAA